MGFPNEYDDNNRWWCKCKGEIVCHPLFQQLLSAHVSCLRIATPVDQLPTIDAQLALSHQLLATYSSPTTTLPHPNLQQFMDYKEKLVDIREEILRKRRTGKLPGDTTSLLKAWWHSHSKWPYPTDEDKARLVQETGLQLKQINNWFINQRKRKWQTTTINPSSSSQTSKRKTSN